MCVYVPGLITASAVLTLPSYYITVDRMSVGLPQEPSLCKISDVLHSFEINGGLGKHPKEHILGMHI